MSHASLLSWASDELGRPLDVAAIIGQPATLPIDGAGALAAMASSVANPGRTPEVFEAVVEAIGVESACDAAAIAANFQIMNRVVDAVGLPIGPKGIEANQSIIDALHLDDFPHGGH